MRQQFTEFLNGMLCNSRENVLEPGERIYLREFAGPNEAAQDCIVLPPRSLPTNIQLCRPTAMLRNERSLWLCRVPDYAASLSIPCAKSAV